jgi:aminomethyltransferase
MVLQLEDDVMWVYNGPSDFDIWARAIAAHTDYDITVITVTRVAPIGLQGPRSYDIMKKVAPEAADMRFFRWVRLPIAGVDTVVVRSGWSGEYGFELCPVNASEAMGVWDALVEEGEQHGLMISSMTGPRYERGVTDTTHGWNLGLNPYETRLGRVVNLDAGPFVGKEALKRIHDEGPTRKSVGLFLDVESLPRMEANWPVTSEGEQAGMLLDYTYSRMFGRYIARALVSASVEVGQTITIHHPGGDADGEVTVIPFPDSGTAKA